MLFFVYTRYGIKLTFVLAWFPLTHTSALPMTIFQGHNDFSIYYNTCNHRLSCGIYILNYEYTISAFLALCFAMVGGCGVLCFGLNYQFYVGLL